MRFNTPPGWPAAPEGWIPPAGWQPDPSWPAPPPGWQLFIDDTPQQGPANLPALRHSGETPVPVVVEAQSVQQTTGPLPPTTPSSAPPRQVPPVGEPGVLWSAVGQPLTGIGAGRYKLTATMLYFERGVLSTNAQQVPIAHVVDVDLRQSLTQKARGVGSVVVKVQRTNGLELVVLEDLPDPRAAVAVINQTAQAARLVEQQRMNTHHYAGLPSMPPAMPPAPVPTAVDPIAQLRQLGELRDAGILTEVEFTTKKAEILSRL
ncbi:hypothetical protein DKT68_10565 [Micromonospora acroterricola]|uniref:PH domain-containing protein n=1 Tax=Micromonospora acroterricola TaxID=2202421 RepID=A0A317D598_9ACTN|nr:hypothetical protein DKT68_10565 [Micromonospora acroterricola]